MNPSYYELEDPTTEGVEKHLTTMIEGVLDDLVLANCIILIDDFEVISTPLGGITSQYYLCYKTVGLFKLRLNDWKVSLSKPKHSRNMIEDENENIDNNNNDSSDINGNGSGNGNSNDRRRKPKSNSAGTDSNNNSNSNKKNSLTLSGSQLITQRLSSSGVCLERLLQLLCDAFEFSELPVRHNEEHLNADLADELPWNTGKSGVVWCTVLSFPVLSYPINLIAFANTCLHIVIDNFNYFDNFVFLFVSQEILT